MLAGRDERLFPGTVKQEIYILFHVVELLIFELYSGKVFLTLFVPWENMFIFFFINRL